ncbi:MAG: SGNH/GDSL hydrolase family protein [Mycetocola sp.]
MLRRNRTFADVGALALAASILFAGSLSTAAASSSAAGAPAVTVQADRGKSPVVNYVALGDSYAAGQGAGFYENECLQSSLSYPELLDDMKHMKLIADASCSGATTADVIGQLTEIRPNKHIDLITLTVGANDVGSAALVAACTASFTSPECQAALTAAIALMTPPAPRVPSELAVRLATTFTAVAMAAPGATIMVTGYPYLFETPPSTDPNYEAIVQLREATTTLNETIEGVVDQLALTGIDIRYVDVTAAFAGHGIGSADPWINATGQDAFHATAAGYLAYSRAIRAEL